MGGYASSLFTNFVNLSAPFGPNSAAPTAPPSSPATASARSSSPRRTIPRPRLAEAPTATGGRDAADAHQRSARGDAQLHHQTPPPGRRPRPQGGSRRRAAADDRGLSAVACPADDATARDLLAEYERLQDELLCRIRPERFDPQRSGRLLGALVEMPSYLDRATDDLPPFEIRYPEHLGGEIIALGSSFPSSWKTPKETILLDRVREHLRLGRKVMVLLRHTGTSELPNRLLQLLARCTPKVAWLDAKKVPPARREIWINENVLAKGVEVFLVNPVAVRTGLNNLVSFSVGRPLRA